LQTSPGFAAKYFWQQTDVARALIAAKDKAVIPSIEPYLDTTDRRNRCNAAFVLAGLGVQRGTDILIHELEDQSLEQRSGEPDFAGHATPEAMLRQRAIGDRYLAALLLGELRAKSAVPALMTATRDPDINYRAATSLGEIGDPRAIPALREMIARFPEQTIWPGYALAAFGEPEGFDVLRAALADPEWVRRREAVWALGKTGDKRAVPILLGALHDEHANVRVAVAQELGRIRDPSALPALRLSLDDNEVTQVNAPTTLAAEASKAIDEIERAP
jgi:HEAT repeat protein